MKTICLPLALLAATSLQATAFDKTITIESVPSGAQVESNGNLICTTPCTMKVSRAYFGTKYTAFSGHVDQPLRIRLTLKGYVPKDETLTEGPRRWQSLNGQNSFTYFLLSSDHFKFNLESVENFVGGSDGVTGDVTPSSADVQTSLSTVGIAPEQIVHNALPAIVQVKTLQGSGSGFFITNHGIVVTNAHVVKDQQRVLVLTSDGSSLETESIYIDQDRDLAFVKVNTTKNSFLELSATLPPQGSEVLAIGTPGTDFKAGTTMLLPNTVTRGIVSGIRSLSATPLAALPGTAGTWIQTDAAINHGNSGGPLLDKSGRVVGINTLSLAPAEMSGIYFALSSGDLIQVARYRFGLSVGSASNLPTVSASMGKPSNTTLSISSTPTGAEIEVDSAFLGNTPAEVPVSAGEHTVKVSKKGYLTYERKLQVLSSGSQRLAIELEPEQR